MHTPATILAVAAIVVTTAIVAIIQAPNISAWEKANDYPFGRMCHSVFTFGVDTCKR